MHTRPSAKAPLQQKSFLASTLTSREEKVAMLDIETYHEPNRAARAF
jgi:hypothetical protein